MDTTIIIYMHPFRYTIAIYIDLYHLFLQICNQSIGSTFPV